jgi:predicted NAD/FAD-binding protein
VLSKNHNKLLNEIDWNSYFVATGVPVIERVAIKDKQVMGHVILKSQRVRIFLDAAGYQEVNCPHFSKLYFGSGPHLCLGMAISKKIWTIIIRELSRVESSLCILDFAYKENDQVFNLLDTLKVKWND